VNYGEYILKFNVIMNGTLTYVSVNMYINTYDDDDDYWNHG